MEKLSYGIYKEKICIRVFEFEEKFEFEGKLEVTAIAFNNGFQIAVGVTNEYLGGVESRVITLSI